MKRILITGVGGNVGQYIANNLAHAGYEVIGVCRNHIPQHADYELLYADLSDTIRGG
ncbi:MAG: NAD-dependent epimerase/dehydratase family protein [Butyrivibrio sp.]|nr:NAD-dependent epimerase/dehydratase family protein [Butyrivibrio sp.]